MLNAKVFTHSLKVNVKVILNLNKKFAYSNGHPDPPRLQRLLWAVTEGTSNSPRKYLHPSTSHTCYLIPPPLPGLTATALLVAGGKVALGALQVSSEINDLKR